MSGFPESSPAFYTSDRVDFAVNFAFVFFALWSGGDVAAVDGRASWHTGETEDAVPARELKSLIGLFPNLFHLFPQP